MKAVIAEKPSVAREIALLLGANEKKEGYITGNGYAVTWALGHLVGLGMPEEYGIEGFRREALPILPAPFVLSVRKAKRDKAYIADPVAVRQLEVIRQVILRADSIIVATDAGREGELIFRYIYEYLGCKKPFERLWISSLTEKAIREGFSDLKPGHQFDGLYNAAKGRSRADWLVGINATQALTIAAAGSVYSLGRVQTPTLALICRRFLENRNFVSQKYWQLQLEHRKEFIDFKTLSKEKFSDRRLADKALKSVQRAVVAIIKEAGQKTVTEQPPLLFDLTGLQKEANKKLGLSAEETLGVAQSLYEQKFITYPRTGSKHIPEDLWAEIPALIRALEDRLSCKPAVAKVKWGQFNRRIVNELKVTDHHGLLITGKIPSTLPAKENTVYDMIALRLVEAIGSVCIKEVTDLVLEVAGYDFFAKGSKIVEAGWRAVLGIFSDDDAEALQELPELEAGDELKIKNAAVLEKKTRPPALYTEAGILSAMESAGKTIEDHQERMVLLQIGIGTPATRAAIIETLFMRGYIERQKKALVPTSKGLQVYELVKDQKIADVAMTAEWELALKAIENGSGSAGAFQEQIEAYAASVTSELLQLNLRATDYPELICPKCQVARLCFHDNVTRCPDVSCGWFQYRKICGVTLPPDEIENLVNNGRTSLIKGMKSKSGKLFNAYIVLNENKNSVFEFAKK